MQMNRRKQRRRMRQYSEKMATVNGCIAGQCVDIVLAKTKEMCKIPSFFVNWSTTEFK